MKLLAELTWITIPASLVGIRAAARLVATLVAVFCYEVFGFAATGARHVAFILLDCRLVQYRRGVRAVSLMRD